MATYPIKLQNGDDILLPITYAGLVQINDNSTTKPLSTAWDSLKISYSSTNGIYIRGISGVKLNGSDKISINPSSNTLTVNHVTTFSGSSSAGPSTVGSSSGQLAHGGSFTVPYIGFDNCGHITSANTLQFTLPASDHTNYGSKIAGPSSSSNSPSHGGTFNVPYVTTDNLGHVTSLQNRTITLPADSNTDVKVAVNSTTTNAKYPLIFKYSNNVDEETTGLRFDSDGTTNSYYNPAKNTLYVKYTYATEFTEGGTKLSSKYVAASHLDTKGSTTAYGHVKVDSSLNSTSTNPVQNKAVYNHTTAHASTSAYAHVKVDDALNSTSTNPVQNKIIYTKMIENEQTTAIGLAVLNSRLDAVEETSSQISNYISKSGSNKVDNDQQIHWSEHSGNKDGLHLTNSSIGWTGGMVTISGDGMASSNMTYASATFSRSGISISDGVVGSGFHFTVSQSASYTYVRIGANNKISLESNGTTGQIVAPKFMENSDERLKTDIEKIASICEINMYEFNMNDSHMYGFVAQDLEKTHPELVTTSSDDSGEINNVKSVDYNSSLSLVVSKLINKITELEERIKELEKK